MSSFKADIYLYQCLFVFYKPYFSQTLQELWCKFLVSFLLTSEELEDNYCVKKNRQRNHHFRHNHVLLFVFQIKDREVILSHQFIENIGEEHAKTGSVTLQLDEF